MILCKHYSKIEYCIKSIVQNSIFFNSVTDFNDPHEKNISFILPDGKKASLADNKNYYKVSCFTSDWNNYLMWSHYSNGHRGFCIEYTFPDLRINNKTKTGQLIEGNDLIRFFKMTYKKNPVSVDHPPHGYDDEEFIKTYTNKYPIWKYENEIRAIVCSRQNKDIIFEKQIISKVLCGENCPEGDIDLLRNICSKYYKVDSLFVSSVVYNSRENIFDQNDRNWYKKIT